MNVPAVQNRLMYITGGNQDFTRTSTGGVELAEILVECMHSRRFDLGH